MKDETIKILIPSSFIFEVILHENRIKIIYLPDGKGSKHEYVDRGIFERMENTENVLKLAQGTYDEIIWLAFLSGINHQIEISKEQK